MPFQSIGYAGQYPPLNPRSRQDVASFTNLHASLRAIPELSKEGDKILNEEMLARFVDGVVRFQTDHLGRKSKSKYWPTVCLPSSIFADRTSYPAGPLGVAILSAFRVKQVSQWRNFNFDNPKLFDDNISILKKMEADLINRGYLTRPVIYFDTSVERSVGSTSSSIGGGIESSALVTSKGGGEIQRLTKIALRFGARVVTDLKDMSEVTHIVAYDPEEHDVTEEQEEANVANNVEEKVVGASLAQKDRRGNDGNTTFVEDEEDVWSSEKKYLKTLTVMDMLVDDDEKGNGEDNKKITRKMALVHWWYHPSSYDEWLPAEEVLGEEGNNFQVSEDPHPGIPGGACVVACKFVKDVEKYNEWGVESDYAIADYERKVDYFKLHNKNENDISTSTSYKKSNKNKRRIAAKTGPILPGTTVEDADDSGLANKKQRLEEDHSIDNGVMIASSSTAKKTKTSGGSRPVPPASSAICTMSSSIYSQYRQTSERRLGTGMNPRRILTGIRGARNEVIRRTVYDGALRVEDEPYKIIKEAMADYLLGYSGRKDFDGDARSAPPLPPTLGARPEWRKLLPFTGFIRPSVHTALKFMTVTELTLDEESPSEDADDDAVVTMLTVAKNVKVPVLISSEVDEISSEPSGGVDGDEPLTIRGGGLEDDTHTFPTQQPDDAAVMPVEQHGNAETDIADMINTPSESENMQVELLRGAVNESYLGETNEQVPNSKVDSAVVASANLAGICVASLQPEQNTEINDQTVVTLADSANTNAATIKSEVDIPQESSSDKNCSFDDSPANKDEINDLATEDNKKLCTDDSIMEEAANDDTAPPAQDQESSGLLLAQSCTSSTTVAAKDTIDNSLERSSVAPAAIVSDVVSSNTAAPATGITTESNGRVCQVKSLPPNTQLSNSLQRAIATPNEESNFNSLARPTWYDPTKASEFEKRMLPEWFNSTAPHRTESTYISTRETVINIAQCNTQQYITTTAIRRSVPGDAGSLLRLHKFLTDWGLMNSDLIGETAPSDAVLRGVHAEGGPLARSKRKYSRTNQHSVSWTTRQMHDLEVSVVKHTSKVSDEGSKQIRISVDWDAVAADVGEGVTASDCQLAFVNPPTKDNDNVVSCLSTNNGFTLSEFLDGVRPEVLKAAVEASLQFTNDITEVRKASIVAVLASAAAQKGTLIESDIEKTLMDIIDQRIQRLENRVALLDDVEALLEAERVSLEMERRDMYTTRCRHWFGDGS